MQEKEFEVSPLRQSIPNSMGKGTNNPTDGTELQKQFRKLTRKKHFSQHLAYGLFYSHPKDEIHPLRRAYIQTIYCGQELVAVKGEDGKMRLGSKRCEGRWCPRCQSVRIAKLIQGYGPALAQLDNLYFVTLTAPTVEGDKLRDQITAFQKRWGEITRQRYWRKKKPIGIRKTECTIRPNGMYHYHWHIIIQGEQNARWIVSQWLKRCPDANGLAQDIRPVKQGEWLEIFKYFTKLVAQDKSTGKRYIDFARLDHVMQVMRGKRVYQPFGGLQQVSEEGLEDVADSIEITEDYEGLWQWATGIGYINEETGEILAGDYKLPTWVEMLAGTITQEEEQIVAHEVEIEERKKKRVTPISEIITK